MQFEFPVVIADIGGTNARFMLLGGASSDPITGPTFKLTDFPTMESAFEDVISNHFKLQPKTIVVALACPIVGDEFSLTNANWTLKPKDFIEKTGIQSLHVMNDFVAQGLGAIACKPADLRQIGNGKSEAGTPKVIIGPGTGLGIVIATPGVGLNNSDSWSLIPGEGGHMDLGPRTEREFAIWPFLRKQKGRMEAELAVSGQGLENIHQAIVKCDQIKQFEDQPLSAREITQTYEQTGDASCKETISMMVGFLARVAADLSILTMPKGGVFLTGGIPKYIEGFLNAPEFRKEFENKAPFVHIMSEIPMFMIKHDQPALLGMTELVLATSRFNLGNAIKSYQSE